jgi:fluoride exporter
MSVLFGYIIVFFGAGIGGLLRLAANRAGILLSLSFPWSTLFVNVSGSLAIGLIAGWFALRSQAGQTLRLFLTTGVLGGYTTFSAFALDTALLWERGQVWGSAFYVASSVLLSIAGVFLGLAIIRYLPS